jgi:hypothetical protein
MNTRDIYTNMNDTLGADCIGYSTVTKYLKEKSFSKSMLGTDFEPKIEEENCIDESNSGALEKCAFSSLRQIAERTLIPMSRVWHELVNSLRYGIRNI